jgi:hypothetical protein
MGSTAGVRFPEGQDFPLLHSVQPPIQMGIGAPFPVRRGVKLTTYLHLVPGSRMMELYLHSPIYLHGIMLN